MTATLQSPPRRTPGARLRAWFNRPRLVRGGHVALYPLDGRTYQQRREDEMRAAIYMITQQNTYLY